MTNQTRRELLDRHKQSGFPGSIIDVFSAYNAGRDLISEFIQEQQLQRMQQQRQPIVASTPEQQEQGLRPFHERGQVDQSMIFPNIPANTPFNTVGMKAPINIDKYDNQGHLIESFKSVPPGIQNLPTGPQEGTVVETPANMQTGGVRKYQTGDAPKIGDFTYGDWREVGREIDPTTNDIIVTEQRDGSRTSGYNRRGVNWDEGYRNWIAKGNVGTLEDFKRKAEAWKSSKTKTEYDTQNRTYSIKSEQDNKEFYPMFPAPTLPPTSIPQSTYGELSYDLVNPNKGGPYGYSNPSYAPGDAGGNPSFITRRPNETIVPDDPNDVGEVLSPSHVQSTYDLSTRSRKNIAGNIKTRSVYNEDVSVTRADGTSSTTKSRQVNRIRPGRKDTFRGKSVFEEFDKNGNRIIRQVDKLRKTGGKLLNKYK